MPPTNPGDKSVNELNDNWSEEISWVDIIESIRNGRCILCTGLGVGDTETDTYQGKFVKYLREHAEKLKIRVYDDGWFHYLPGHNVIAPHNRIKAFFNQPFPRTEEIYAKIAQIPFHFVISVTPDYKLKEAFAEYPNRFSAYHKNKTNDTTTPPTPDLPLVYNMMGEVGVRDSLVLTYDDFYAYLESIFRGEGRSMALELEELIADADNFIFLGMPFDRWQMHLFLRILRQHKNRHLLKYSPGIHSSERVRNQAQEQFNITCITVDEEKFVAELSARCEKAGLIRSKGSGPAVADAPLAHLRAMIGKDEITEVITEMEQLAAKQNDQTGKELLMQIITLSGQYTNASNRYRVSVINDKEYRQEVAQVRVGLLGIIDLLEKKMEA